jgi:hypothetical protein
MECWKANELWVRKMIDAFDIFAFVVLGVLIATVVTVIVT